MEGEKPAQFTPHAIHLVRTATQVNLSLSQMADQKASILMGATFVVFTIAVGQAGKGNFPVALMVLAISAFLSAMCAVAAILPSIRPPKAEADDGGNILFFGIFTQLSEEDFAQQVLGRRVNAGAHARPVTNSALSVQAWAQMGRGGRS